MYTVVIAPNVPSTLLAKCLPQELNLYEDSTKIDGEALIRDNQNLVAEFTRNGIHVIQLEQSMQDALVQYLKREPQYVTLFEEKGFREQGPKFQRTIDNTPKTIDDLIASMQKWSKDVLTVFNEKRELARYGVELTEEEWRLIERQILADRDGIQDRHKCSREEAMRYALTWNNLLFRGDRPYTLREIMMAHSGGKKDHVAGGTVVSREGVIMTTEGTRNSADFTLPIGSNMFFATDTHEVFSIEGDDDYFVVLGNMEKLMRKAEPSLVRAGLINLGLDSKRIRQPQEIWEGGNLIKFLGDCQVDYKHKAIYIGITERTGYLAAQSIARILHDFLVRNNIEIRVVDLPKGGNSHVEAQENMHLDFKGNWFLEPDRRYAVVLNAAALQKSAGEEMKYYRVIPLAYKQDTNDLEGKSAYLISPDSEEILAHFQRLKREGVVSKIHLLSKNEAEFGANFVDGVRTGKVYIAPSNYKKLNRFVKRRARQPVLLELVNNAAFGSVRCSTTTFYAGDFLRRVLESAQATRYIRRAI